VQSTAVIIKEPKVIALEQVRIDELGDTDVAVEMEWSGISTGTEKLLWSGRMPNFPGMGYPLVPGYESVGRVIQAGKKTHLELGARVFVPGAKCFGDVRGLFGGSASHVVLPESRVTQLDESLGEEGVLLALAATAYHVTGGDVEKQPDLIIGHGVVGRLLARIAALKGQQVTVWETNPERMGGALGYHVTQPEKDDCKQYKIICDASGDAKLINTLIGRMNFQGEIVLAGFYEESISFMFAPAFMKEIRMRIAAQWQPSDLVAVQELIANQQLNLSGLITHHDNPSNAQEAYQTAFTDTQCLKMVLNWKNGNE
jgi:3-hydroxyethyl bacteriochlorophyllide a dehydrogenase